MSAIPELAAILRNLPFAYRTQGDIAAVAHAYRLGCANVLWSRREALRLALRANMERGQAIGRGSAAKRRRLALLDGKRASRAVAPAPFGERMTLAESGTASAQYLTEYYNRGTYSGD